MAKDKTLKVDEKKVANEIKENKDNGAYDELMNKEKIFEEIIKEVDKEIPDKEIKKVKMFHLRAMPDIMVVGKVIGDKVHNCVKIISEYYAVTGTDGKVVTDGNGNAQYNIETLLKPFAYPFNGETSGFTLEKTDLIEFNESGENNTPEMQKHIKFWKKQYVKMIKNSSLV